MKRLVIIAMIALFLTGGGLGAAYFFVPELLGVNQEKPDQPKEPPKPKKKELIKPATLHMSTIDVPLVMGETVDRKIYYDVTLVVDPETYSDTQVYLPRLRNAFIQFSYAAFPKQYERDGHMDLRKLKVSLTKIAKKTLGEDVIKDVLIMSYLER